MTKILFTERSAGPGSWAFYNGTERVCGGIFESAVPRAPTWFTDVLSGLAKCSVAVADIDGIVVGTGPGSFSGIRANLAAVQGLCMPAGKPVLGISSAASLAFSTAESLNVSSIAVAGDARRGQIWLAVYSVEGGRLLLGDKNPVSHSAADFRLVPAEAFADAVPEGIPVVSSEYERLADLIRRRGESASPTTSLFPDADMLAKLYLAQPETAVRDALPVYLQPAVAAKK